MSQQPIHQICTNSKPKERFSVTKRHQGLCSRLPDGYLQFLAKNPNEEFRHPLWFREWKKREDQRKLQLRLMMLQAGP